MLDFSGVRATLFGYHGKPKFNASLRNVIERIFGILKMRFPVLTNPVRYPVEFQSDMVIALCVVHNYIRIQGGKDDDIEQRANDALDKDDSIDEYHEHPENGVISQEASRQRDTIAFEMWHHYQKYLAARKQKRSQIRQGTL